MSQSREKVKAAIYQVLSALSEDERKLFSQTLKLEGENLHQKRPHLRDDLVKLVKQVIK